MGDEEPERYQRSARKERIRRRTRVGIERVGSSSVEVVIVVWRVLDLEVEPEAGSAGK